MESILLRTDCRDGVEKGSVIDLRLLGEVKKLKNVVEESLRSHEVMTELLAELVNEAKLTRKGGERTPLTRDEAAAYLQVHPDTVYKWAREGRLSYSRLGEGAKAPLRFIRKDLDAFMSGQRIATAEEMLSRF